MRTRIWRECLFIHEGVINLKIKIKDLNHTLINSSRVWFPCNSALRILLIVAWLRVAIESIWDTRQFRSVFTRIIKRKIKRREDAAFCSLLPRILTVFVIVRHFRRFRLVLALFGSRWISLPSRTSADISHVRHIPGSHHATIRCTADNSRNLENARENVLFRH